eukprot:g2779.t1
MKTRIPNSGPRIKIRTSTIDRVLRPRREQSLRIRCASGAVRKQDRSKPAISNEVTSFAPATIANFGPGFDWLGCAVEGDGDIVIAKKSDSPGVKIERIFGDNGKLSMNPKYNCIGVAAFETLRLMNRVSSGVSLTLKKGLPLGSGLGSSAASAAASAWAVNCLFGSPLTKEELVIAGLKAEEVVSGYHADNVAPAILGGFVMIESLDPVKITKLTCPESLYFALVTPKFQAPTAKMRAALPHKVPMKHLTHNCCMAGMLINGILTGDLEKMGQALSNDIVVEPVRGPLIPGFAEVKEAAMKYGAFGCTISGAGPTILALVDGEVSGQKVIEEMKDAFCQKGKLEIEKSRIVKLDNNGAKLLS